MASAAIFDIAIIGGGINGCGIARDAAGRGYSVFLAEMSDLGSGTSSGSTKLIHGGLRYLEHYEFRLVREALKEREVLWRNGPHIVRPMRFLLPHHRGLRPAWLLRLGLFLYDHIGGRKLLPKTRSVDLRRDQAGRLLKPLFARAFEFSDCWVEDARLVVLNAVDAAEKGATISPRTAVSGARRENDVWVLDLRDTFSGEISRVRARMLVNAAGPWVENVLTGVIGRNHAHAVRLVQGSHIVVRRKFDDPRAFFFQNGDGRIIFAIPYEGDFTLIGTTDLDYVGDPKDVAVSEAEIDYLCRAASEYFVEPVTRSDIVWTYSAVRPLYDDGASKAQEATRDYVLKVDGRPGEPSVLNIFGGKITTYRRLAEAAMERIGAVIGPKGQPWTRQATLPGGDFDVAGFEAEAKRLADDYPFLEAASARRLVRQYGTRAWTILGESKSPEDLGRRFGWDFYERELRHLVEHEWAMTVEDVIWRRTKLGLRLLPEEVAALGVFLEEARSRRGRAAAE